MLYIGAWLEQGRFARMVQLHHYALGIDKALTVICEDAGTGLDEDIVNTCVTLFEENKFEWR